jgi:hypothetical protein
LLVAIPTLASLIRFRDQLAAPRRWNFLLFAVLAPWDVRLLAAFGVPATIVLAATVFRKAADSRRIRFFLKHAEWTYHWLVFFAAVWILVRFAPRFGLG